MKTGRLLKFQRPGGQVHAYLYTEGGVYRAAIYVNTGEGAGSHEPVHRIEGSLEAEVEAELRRWLDRSFPREGS